MYAIAWGTLAGTGVELLLLMAAARAAGVGLSLHLDFRDPLLRKVLLLMVPITITLGILNFNALVDTFFAQFVNNRAAAEIDYSFRLYQLPQGIFAVTIGTILFPSLSRFAATEESDRFRETLSMGVRQMFFVSLPFVAWFALLPRPFVQLVYQRGAFGGLATHDVAAALAGFSAGLAFANANIMFNRGFQSLKRPWLPLYAALVNLALNAVLDWVLLGPLGVAGITLVDLDRLGVQLRRAGVADAAPGRARGRAPHRARAGRRAGVRGRARGRELRRLARPGRLGRARLPGAVGVRAGDGGGRRRRRLRGPGQGAPPGGAHAGVAGAEAARARRAGRAGARRAGRRTLT